MAFGQDFNDDSMNFFFRKIYHFHVPWHNHGKGMFGIEILGLTGCVLNMTS